MDKNKYLLLLKYILDSYVRTFLFTVPFFVFLYLFLKLSGMYSKLDLKFDSPLILLPLFASLALSVIVLLFGLILYVYKYKRNTSSTPFYKAVSGAIDEKLRDKNK
ncbi:MAG: hypothetical protein E7510_13265 [Ruminococcus sp.]|nr:hypothetical protein [Ruminococcus sp.]